MEATLNNRNVTVWRKNADGSRILDKQATAAAQEKQEKVLAEFQKWMSNFIQSMIGDTVF